MNFKFNMPYFKYNSTQYSALGSYITYNNIDNVAHLFALKL